MSTEFFAFEGAEGSGTEPSAAAPSPVAASPIAAAPAEPQAVPGTWDGDIDSLQSRFPGTRLGTLFCIHKLEQDPDLQLRDFKAEAELRGVPLSGRSFHGARVLLGLEAPKPRRARADETGIEEVVDAGFSALSTPPVPNTAGVDIESVLRTAIDAAAAQRTEGMRDAIRKAIAVLEEALED
jgi:hypothetical protein